MSWTEVDDITRARHGGLNYIQPRR